MKRFTAGWNQPGYLPEMEPAEFNSESAAREFILTELRECLDRETAWERVPDWEDCILCIENGDTDVSACDGYNYWIEEREE